MRNLGLYLHIPFCVKKCNYCDFYSLGCSANGGIERYIDALCKHVRYEGEKYRDREVDTVFLGGGTPSILSPHLVKELFCTVRESFNLTSDCEISLEANPGTVTEEKVATAERVVTHLGKKTDLCPTERDTVVMQVQAVLALSAETPERAETVEHLTQIITSNFLKRKIK